MYGLAIYGGSNCLCRVGTLNQDSSLHSRMQIVVAISPSLAFNCGCLLMPMAGISAEWIIRPSIEHRVAAGDYQRTNARGMSAIRWWATKINNKIISAIKQVNQAVILCYFIVYLYILLD